MRFEPDRAWLEAEDPFATEIRAAFKPLR